MLGLSLTFYKSVGANNLSESLYDTASVSQSDR